MVINYFGDNCFRITSGSLTLLTDPTSNRLKGDIVLKTSALTPFSSKEDIVGAGEYELKEIRIDGFEVKNESTLEAIKTVYLADVEEMRLCFLGHIAKTPEAEIIEKLGNVDILFLPVGGKYLSEEEAAKLVLQLKPKIIIPSSEGDAKNIKKFLEILGQDGKPQDKLTLKAKELADASLKVVILEKA